MWTDSNLTRNARKRSLVTIASLLALLVSYPLAANAVGDGATDDTYSWSAELVSLDEAAGTAVVRALVLGHASADDLADLTAGERVSITWSGMRWASGIRGVTRDSGSDLDGLTLPAEFVSWERDGRYLVFSVPVPSDALEKVSSLSPGEWVTLSSPRSPSDWMEAVVDARPYNDVEYDDVG